MKDLNKVERYVALLLTVLFAVGIIGYAVPGTRSMVHATTESFLWLTGITVLVFSIMRHERRSRYVMVMLIIFAVTVLIEIAGVQTGHIFGVYRYGDLFKLRISGVPVIIGINWTIAVFGAYSLAYRAVNGSIFFFVLIPLFIFSYDFLLEPVAVHLNYWHWESNIIPIQNYLAWIIVSLIFSAVIYFAKLNRPTPMISFLWLIQLVFFTVLHIVLEIPFITPH